MVSARTTTVLMSAFSTTCFFMISTILPMFFIRMQRANTLMFTQIHKCHQDSNDIWRQLTQSKLLGRTRRQYHAGGYEASGPPAPSGSCCSCQQGPPGPPGSRGQDGEPGRAGRVGSDGRNGHNGRYVKSAASAEPPCQKCPMAPPGPPGHPGHKGPRGRAGTPGKNGTPGTPGRAGPRGPSGVRGAPGEPGMQGPPGDSGKVLNAAPQGPPGRPGPIGPRGKPGTAGPDGQPGVIGPRGIRGLQGDRGSSGALGPPGPPGAPGPVGNQGSCKHCPVIAKPAHTPRSPAQQPPSYAQRQITASSSPGYGEEPVSISPQATKTYGLSAYEESPASPAPVSRNYEEAKSQTYGEAPVRPSSTQHLYDSYGEQPAPPAPVPKTYESQSASYRSTSYGETAPSPLPIRANYGEETVPQPPSPVSYEAKILSPTSISRPSKTRAPNPKPAPTTTTSTTTATTTTTTKKPTTTTRATTTTKATTTTRTTSTTTTTPATTTTTTATTTSATPAPTTQDSRLYVDVPLPHQLQVQAARLPFHPHVVSIYDDEPVEPVVPQLRRKPVGNIAGNQFGTMPTLSVHESIAQFQPKTIRTKQGYNVQIVGSSYGANPVGRTWDASTPKVYNPSNYEQLAPPAPRYSRK